MDTGYELGFPRAVLPMPSRLDNCLVGLHAVHGSKNLEQGRRVPGLRSVK